MLQQKLKPRHLQMIAVRARTPARSDPGACSPEREQVGGSIGTGLFIGRCASRWALCFGTARADKCAAFSGGALSSGGPLALLLGWVGDAAPEGCAMR
jgi:hypothetical protein